MLGASIHRSGSGQCIENYDPDEEASIRVLGGTVLVIGAIGLVLAATLLGVGGHRFRKWRRSQRVQATWTAGPTLRF